MDELDNELPTQGRTTRLLNYNLGEMLKDDPTISFLENVGDTVQKSGGPKRKKRKSKQLPEAIIESEVFTENPKSEQEQAPEKIREDKPDQIIEKREEQILEHKPEQILEQRHISFDQSFGPVPVKAKPQSPSKKLSDILEVRVEPPESFALPANSYKQPIREDFEKKKKKEMKKPLPNIDAIELQQKSNMGHPIKPPRKSISTIDPKVHNSPKPSKDGIHGLLNGLLDVLGCGGEERR